MAAVHRSPLSVKCFAHIIANASSCPARRASHPGASPGKTEHRATGVTWTTFHDAEVADPGLHAQALLSHRAQFSQSPGTESRRLLTAFFRLI